MSEVDSTNYNDEELVIANIKTVIERIRPYINQDGGDLQYVAYKDGKVYVSLLGACAQCGLIDSTLKDGIEAILLDEIPQVKEVVLAN